jgi:hypothetical protein
MLLWLIAAAVPGGFRIRAVVYGTMLLVDIVAIGIVAIGIVTIVMQERAVNSDTPTRARLYPPSPPTQFGVGLPDIKPSPSPLPLRNPH